MTQVRSSSRVFQGDQAAQGHALSLLSMVYLPHSICFIPYY